MPLRYFLPSILLLFSLFFHVSIVAQVQGKAPTADRHFLHYKVYGKGTPLVIINGGPGMNSKGFESLAIELSKNYRVIIYDQRGTGNSVLPKLDESTINMKLMVEDIESLRRHLKFNQWNVLGHSFGGMLASYYATVYPERINRLVLSSSGGIDLELLDYLQNEIHNKLTDSQRIALNFWNAKISSGDTSYSARLQRGLNLAHAYVYDKKFVPLIGQRLTEGNSTINQLLWSDLRRMKFDCAPKLKSFSRPVLIIHGLNDILRRTTAMKIKNAFPTSKVVFLDKSAHYGWLDQPEQYYSAVVNFLEDKE